MSRWHWHIEALFQPSTWKSVCTTWWLHLQPEHHRQQESAKVDLFQTEATTNMSWLNSSIKWSSLGSQNLSQALLKISCFCWLISVSSTCSMITPSRYVEQVTIFFELMALNSVLDTNFRPLASILVTSSMVWLNSRPFLVNSDLCCFFVSERMGSSGNP